MRSKINNLVFEGGGVLGVSYLGVLDYLNSLNILQGIERVGGTSAGAITACIVSFNLPFNDSVSIANSLDYKKVPDAQGRGDDEIFSAIDQVTLKYLDKLFGNFRCVYRLLKKYGWYSTDYFYDWIKAQIALQFDPDQKASPYTFADFKNSAIHKDHRPFLDLRVIGTNVSYSIANIFSYETTPNMEVAEAIKISMSVPFFFETMTLPTQEFFCDGGVVKNYPINLFDSDNIRQTKESGIEYLTLGAHFDDYIRYKSTDNFVGYVQNVLSAFGKAQVDAFLKNPVDVERSIHINIGSTPSLDFNISPYDSTYNALYKAGYDATERYFLDHSQLLKKLFT